MSSAATSAANLSTAAMAAELTRRGHSVTPPVIRALNSDMKRLGVSPIVLAHSVPTWPPTVASTHVSPQPSRKPVMVAPAHHVVASAVDRKTGLALGSVAEGISNSGNQLHNTTILSEMARGSKSVGASPVGPVSFAIRSASAAAPAAAPAAAEYVDLGADEDMNDDETVDYSDNADMSQWEDYAFDDDGVPHSLPPVAEVEEEMVDDEAPIIPSKPIVKHAETWLFGENNEQRLVVSALMIDPAYGNGLLTGLKTHELRNTKLSSERMFPNWVPLVASGTGKLLGGMRVRRVFPLTDSWFNANKKAHRYGGKPTDFSWVWEVQDVIAIPASKQPKIDARGRLWIKLVEERDKAIVKLALNHSDSYAKGYRKYV